MRHTIAENVNVLGKFDTGDAVTIALYKISDGSVVGLDSNSCTHLAEGIFKWNSSEITTAPIVFTEYLWVMDNSTYKQYGKIVLGGFPDQIKTETDKIQSIKSAIIILSGTINDVLPTNTEFNTDLTQTVDNYWNRGALIFTSGQNIGIIRKMQDYTGDTKRIKLRTALPYTPIDGDTFNIIPLRAFRTNFDDVIKIVNDVWDEQIIEHTNITTFGGKNQKIIPSETVDDYKADVDDIPTDAELDSKHGSGSWEGLGKSDWTTDEKKQIRSSLGVNGEKIIAINGQLQRILGLSNENMRIFESTYDKGGNLVSGKIKTYPSAADVDNDTNALAEYEVKTNYGKGKFRNNPTGYRVKKIG